MANIQKTICGAVALVMLGAAANSATFKATFTTAGGHDVQGGANPFIISGTPLDLPITGSFLIDTSVPATLLGSGPAAFYHGAVSEFEMSFGGGEIFTSPSGFAAVNTLGVPPNGSLSFQVTSLSGGTSYLGVVPTAPDCEVFPKHVILQIFGGGIGNTITAPVSLELLTSPVPAYAEVVIPMGWSGLCGLSLDRELVGKLTSFEVVELMEPVPLPASGALFASLLGLLTLCRRKVQSAKALLRGPASSA